MSQVHSQTGFRAVPHRGGLTLTDKAAGRKLEVGLESDAVTLQGDGFSHDIRVSGDTVTVRDTVSGHSASLPRLPFLKDAQRAAVGVAAMLTGLPVHLFTGEKAEPVYVNLGWRVGMGVRHGGSSEGGRYRVREMNRDFTGADIGVKDGFIHLGTQKRYDAPVTDLRTRSGMPLSIDSAYRRMTGTTFVEAYQGSLVDMWRTAGKPDSLEHAWQVADYAFGLAYEYNPENEMYRENPKTAEFSESLRWGGADTWKILDEACAHHSDVNTVLQRLNAR